MRKIKKMCFKAVTIALLLCLATPVGVFAETPDSVSQNVIPVEEVIDHPVLEQGGCVGTVLTTEASTQQDPEVAAMVNRAVGEATYPGMTDLQKALALHDWLATHCRYTSSGSSPYSAKSALLEGKAVCQGYYGAYKLLLDAVGIENGYGQSDNHIWNKVKIDGQWYNVDPTWGGQEVWCTQHAYFLKSDASYAKTHPTVIAQSHSCSSTKYDNVEFWSADPDRQAFHYYSANESYQLSCGWGNKSNPAKMSIVYRNDSTGTTKTVASITPTTWWPFYDANDTTVCYDNAQMVKYGDELYFNDAKNVYRVTNQGKTISKYYTYTGAEYICGIMVCQNQLVLRLKPYIYDRGANFATIDLPAYRWEWPQVVQLPSAYAFVNRLYTVCLGRNAESAGLNDWYAKLANHEQSAAQVAQGFFFSPEFQNKHYSNEEYIKVLYRTMFGREADEGGLNDWLNQMENGMSREYVYRGFAQSPEFSNLCAGYGVIRGEVTLTAYRDQNAGATGFIARLYTKMLGRSYDDAGLEYWCRMYLTGQQSIEEVASHGFLHSQELLNQNLSDKEFVTRMYQTFLNREPDAEGLQYWLTKLKTGEKTRDNLVYGFTLSREFANVKQAYGLP